MTWSPPRALVISWLALLGLLTLTVFLAYQPLAGLNFAAALTIASVKVVIVAAIFMELRERNAVIIAVASAGLFWLAILIWLSGIDFITRTAAWHRDWKDSYPFHRLFHISDRPPEPPGTDQNIDCRFRFCEPALYCF
jgi:cytochrome c oxidase subunit IV